MSKARLVITAVTVEKRPVGEVARSYGGPVLGLHTARDRVRTDKVGTTGTVTLRHAGRLHRIGIGRTHAGTHILLLVQDLNIRIINAATGELLRQLTLNPDRIYQRTGKPPGPPPGTPRPPRKTTTPNP